MKKHRLPKGFLASGIHCGVKKKRKDLSLLYSKTPCKVEAIFTRNAVKAAPLLVAEEQLKKGGYFSGVVINSGNANCMTGDRGLSDARKMAAVLARLLGTSKDAILVSSTGIIGKFMPMRPITGGMFKLVAGLSADGLVDAAEGIMTTDRFHKIASRTFVAGGRKITMTGIAKGAGMVKPDMATMLCYILTDANVSKKAMKKALLAAAETSFNAITVDGDMSTNDTAMLLANGEAGNRLIKENGKDLELFQKNLSEVSGELARMIVRDGEGASKFIKVCVKGARTVPDAKKMAGAIADSLLVKCAVLGGDPNWGRIASSAGASGVAFDPDKMEVILDGVTFYKSGNFKSVAGRKAASVFKGEDVQIEVDLHSGEAEACIFSCDISKKYITLNAHYTT